MLKEHAKSASFEGNPQSFRIVTRLARRSAVHPGLNLTGRTLNGLLTYPWLRADAPAEVPEPETESGPGDDGSAASPEDQAPLNRLKWASTGVTVSVFDWARTGLVDGERTLEAELMDWADDVTYAVRHMDDFYRAGIVPLDRLTSDTAELARFKEDLRTSHRKNGGVRLADSLRSTVQWLPFVDPQSVHGQDGRARQPARARIRAHRTLHRGSAGLRLRRSGVASFVIDDRLTDEVRVLKELTWFYVIKRPSLSIIQCGQAETIGALFAMYQTAVKKSGCTCFPGLRGNESPGPATRSRRNASSSISSPA